MVSGHYAEWRESQTVVPMERQEITAPENQIAAESRAE
jgi:hypothetical protein